MHSTVYILMNKDDFESAKQHGNLPKYGTSADYVDLTESMDYTHDKEEEEVESDISEFLDYLEDYVGFSVNRDNKSFRMDVDIAIDYINFSLGNIMDSSTPWHMLDAIRVETLLPKFTVSYEGQTFWTFLNLMFNLTSPYGLNGLPDRSWDNCDFYIVDAADFHF